MAPSPKYYVWTADGKPFTLMRPARALQGALQAHGLTVYAYPNEAHQRANPPEDHTPYSASGWPVGSAYGIGHAIDVMPRTDTPAGRAENAALARKLIADRNAGVPGVLWIKYLNWTDESGICRQERWMPNHTSTTSTDKGHIHVSGRSDCDTDARADSYDPLTPAGVTMASVLTGDEQRRLKNVDEYAYGIASEADPLPNIVGGAGAAVVVPNLPYQRAKRLEQKVDELLARPAAGGMTPAEQEAQAQAIADRVLAVLATKIGDVVTQALLGPEVRAAAVEDARQGANLAEDS